MAPACIPSDCTFRLWGASLGPLANRATGERSWPLPAGGSSNFIYDGGDWLAGRKVFRFEEAFDFIRPLLGSDTEPRGGIIGFSGIEGVPAFHAELSPPDTLIRVFPNVGTPVACLVASAVRPCQGIFWESTREGGIEISSVWELDGTTFYTPTFCLLGLAVPNPRCCDGRRTCAGALRRSTRTSSLAGSDAR